MLSSKFGHLIPYDRGAAGALVLLLFVSIPFQQGQAQSNKEASKVARQNIPTRVDTLNLVWPPPPEPPRIRFIREITGESDVIPEVKKKRSWLERTAGVREEEPARARLAKPYGVTTDSRGRIYVADSASRVVFVFDLEKQQLTFRGDKGKAGFAVPVGVAVDNKDRLFVSDAWLHRLTCFDRDGKVLEVFGADKLERAAGLAIDNNARRLYVADAKANRVAIFDVDSFAFLGYLGKSSNPERPAPGAFSGPTNVAVDASGSLYVVDTGNNRIQIFDRGGNFVLTFGAVGKAPGTFRRPKGVAVDRDGHVYVADAEFNNFQILTREGQPLLAVGSIGLNPGQFSLPAGIAVDGNRVYVADQVRGRIQVFHYISDAEAAAAHPARSAGLSATQRLASAGK